MMNTISLGLELMVFGIGGVFLSLLIIMGVIFLLKKMFPVKK
ncbi:MAG: OadG family protein [Clostridiales bacterium]|nr:OadG family protein [Clostridiales bacterium]